MLERVIEPMLRAREALRAEYHALHRALLAIVREDTICRRLMTVPGVGALVAITFTRRSTTRAVSRDPARWARTSASRRRISVRRDRRHRRDQQSRRRDGAERPL